MPSSAQLRGALRVLHHFVAALGDTRPRWNSADRRVIALGFHALRAVQQRLDIDSLDDAFGYPLVEHLDAEQNGRDALATDGRIPPATRDALRLLCSRLLADEARERIIEALAAFANRLRNSGLHALAIDAFLVLVDAYEQCDDQCVDEMRCITGMNAMTAADWDTFDMMLAALQESGGRDAPVWALNLEARRTFLRGNLPEAERAARRAVSLVDKSSPSRQASLAYHVLGVAIGVQGRHREATAALFDAYRYATDTYRAQWTLVALATGLFSLGRIDAAADCCALLANAESPNLRGATYITAIRIAARRGELAEVSRLRSEIERLLDREILSAEPISQLCYMLGAALRHVGDADGARTFWTRGIDVARSHHINQVLYLLDNALTSGHEDAEAIGSPPLPEPVAEPSDEADAGLADAEWRLHTDRVARDLEMIG